MSVVGTAHAQVGSLIIIIILSKEEKKRMSSNLIKYSKASIHLPRSLFFINTPFFHFAQESAFNFPCYLSSENKAYIYGRNYTALVPCFCLALIYKGWVGGPDFLFCISFHHDSSTELGNVFACSRELKNFLHCNWTSRCSSAGVSS
jgi:hypothetical protein